MVYNFLCKDEKTRRNIYLLLLKTSVWKEVRHFFRTVYSNRNHVTTHPDHLVGCYSRFGSLCECTGCSHLRREEANLGLDTVWKIIDKDQE